MNELSEDEKTLGLRLLLGEVTEVQFNFLCHQKGSDKEKILQYNQDLQKRANITFFAVVLTFFILISLSLRFFGVL